MRNMMCALIEHERIVTTEAKAKALRRHAEKVVGHAKRWALCQQAAATELKVRGAPRNCNPAGVPSLRSPLEKNYWWCGAEMILAVDPTVHRRPGSRRWPRRPRPMRSTTSSWPTPKSTNDHSSSNSWCVSPPVVGSTRRPTPSAPLPVRAAGHPPPPHYPFLTWHLPPLPSPILLFSWASTTSGLATWTATAATRACSSSRSAAPETRPPEPSLSTPPPPPSAAVHQVALVGARGVGSGPLLLCDPHVPPSCRARGQVCGARRRTARGQGRRRVARPQHQRHPCQVRLPPVGLRWL